MTHDVDCAAAILTLRHLRESGSLDTINAVFVTTNKWVVDTVTDWYKNQGKSGVPPMVRHLTVSTAAWLKKPAAAGNVKLHELIASCFVALQPNAKHWRALKDHLEDLIQSGKLTSEEMVAVVAHELTETRLIESDDTDYEDASTVIEIIELARKQMSAEAEAKRAESDAARATAEHAAAVSAERQRQTELNVLAAATKTGNVARAAAFWIGVVLFGAGVIVSLAGVVGLVGLMLALPAGIASLAVLIFGGNLKRWTERIGEWVRLRELKRILGSEAL